MADIPISEFGLKNIEQAYAQIKTTALFIAPTGLVMFFALALLVKKVYGVISEAKEKAGIDMKTILGLTWIYALYAMVIMLMPVGIYIIEFFLADMQDQAITALGGEPKGPVDTMLAEMEEMERRYPSGVSFFFNSITEIIGYYNVLIIKPFLSVFIRYIYAMYITFRFAFLLLLEIVFPIALIMLLDEKRSSLFDKWVVNMIICYLMVPVFIMSVALADKITITIFGYANTLLAIFAQFVMKLFLLKKMQDALFKAL